MSRIKSLFSSPKEKVIPFFTAGYPKLNSTVDLVIASCDAGADMIEIGIPFSDPQADGPVIQASSQKALENGITINKIFQQVEEIRKSIETPIALMGYINPILKMGTERFLDRCCEASIDGLILPDLPLTEAESFCVLAREKGVSPILLVAPNTSGERIRLISNMAGDLIYAVSVLGITGNALSSRKTLKGYLSRVRENSSCPFIVGFGIKNRDDIIWFNKQADGAVIGSEIIKIINGSKNPAHLAKNYIKELKGKL